MIEQRSVESAVAGASRALILGIGGGGDVVGALAVARYVESLGTEFELGGVSWERTAIDGHHGPWALSEVMGARVLVPSAALANAATRTPTGVRFSEALMAGHLGRDTVLIDPTHGPAEIADGIVAAAGQLGCDLILYVDVGGDVLARGDEPGLGSPLCDAIMLAAACRAAVHIDGIACVIGAGCDGELTAGEVVDRVGELARAGAWLGAAAVPPTVVDELEQVARVVPTEASLQLARCARGERGEAEIRGGRRRVQLGPLGALSFFFDPEGAVRHAAPLARAVIDAADLDAAQSALAAIGVRTELDFEREQGD